MLIRRRSALKEIERLKEKLRISEMEHEKDRSELKTKTLRVRELEEKLNKLENAD